MASAPRARHRAGRWVPMVAACTGAWACATPAPPAPPPSAEQVAARAGEQVLAQLARYEDAIRRMDSAKAASLFDDAGQLDHAGGTPIRGPMAIKTFLDSYAAFHVVSHVNRARSTVITGDHAAQTGDFDQTVISPDGKTIHATGRFSATWVRESDGQWRLLRMHTEPGG